MAVERKSDTWKRRGAVACAVYFLCTVVYFIVAGDRTEQHTQNNHYAVQAEVWKAGRWYLTEEDISARARRGELDMGNDWAVVRKEDPQTHVVEVRYFNSFPVFPAVVMYPFVSAAGSALMFKDAQFIVMLAGLGPALLFLALEVLRLQRRSPRTQLENAGFAVLLAFGTVYFFSAVQGTVWFSAHVVAMALIAGYLCCSFRADSLIACAVAGVLIGCGFHTRPPLLLGVALFAWEAARVSLRASTSDPSPDDASVWIRAKDLFQRLDLRRLLVRYALFSAPVLVAIWLQFSINKARFGDPWEFGHTLLNVVWMERVKRFGLFSYHYLSRNLTCAFTLLPILNPVNTPANVGRLQVSGNGLALWVTSPFYLWLLWPKVRSALHWVVWATLIPIAYLDLTYQNSGWIQFGYRFSNDFSPFLLVLLAIGARPLGVVFRAAAIASIAINTFGAVSFQRRGYEKFYFLQTYSVPIYNGTPSLQSTTYPPD